MYEGAPQPRHDTRHRPSLQDPRRPPGGPVTDAHIHSTRPALQPIMWGLLVGAIQAASPGRRPVGRARSPARALHRVDRSRLHRLRCGRRQTKSHRRREHDRRRILRPRYCRCHRISLAADSRLRRPWRQRPLATPNQVRCSTRWWPPFCAAVDFLVAAILAVELAAGMSFH